MAEDARASEGVSDEVTVRFPELPVVSYLGVMAWNAEASEVIVSDPGLESVARANGVPLLDREIVHLKERCRAAFIHEAARAVRTERPTMSPTVVAPLRLWRQGLDTFDRAQAWLARLGAAGSSPIPEPTREVETAQRRLVEAVRAAYGGT